MANPLSMLTSSAVHYWCGRLLRRHAVHLRQATSGDISPLPAVNRALTSWRWFTARRVSMCIKKVPFQVLAYRPQDPSVLLSTSKRKWSVNITKATELWPCKESHSLRSKTERKERRKKCAVWWCNQVTGFTLNVDLAWNFYLPEADCYAWLEQPQLQQWVFSYC